MPGVIEGGTHQVVHRGIDDGEIACLAMLEIFDAGQQQSGIADNRPAWLEQDLLFTIADDIRSSAETYWSGGGGTSSR